MEIRSERAHPLQRRPPKARTLASTGEDREKQEPSQSKMVQHLWKITGQELNCYHMTVNPTLKTTYKN